MKWRSPTDPQERVKKRIAAFSIDGVIGFVSLPKSFDMRGLLSNFGLKVGVVSAGTFEGKGTRAR